MVAAAPACHPTERQFGERTPVSPPTGFTGSSTMQLLALPKVKIAMKGSCDESVQSTETGMTVQLKIITKENFQNCFRGRQEPQTVCSTWQQGF